ncbi:Crp/Fnr family transcriptional regulator [Halomonas korlensis]|uniref:cAMP-binding domain of CRP or a regulatory subunit of cAMP-dependent protein kinases n=1 Tax=Halomonas korlensis TaxID=463301 RepID=A0A1I7KHK1_9GAMM|nr:Crp/Fnr family transcriptional regulator [Halomonas korlensis]SFU96882.1 cAMP-binding domain of CRP or a regulatory subunit of cAMP-dependent protein kinases [Halomonas korlensis]
MIDALINKLENYLTLSDADKQHLTNAVDRVEDIKKDQDIILVNEKPEFVHLIIEGWACRYKLLADGQRAIVAYLIPGDLCDIHIALLDHMDHSVCSLTPLKIAYLSREKIEEMFFNNNTLARAFFWSALIEESIMREWFANVTSRPADKRLAHMFCEIMMRYRAAGLTDRHDSIHFPLTQNELADAAGLSVVHTNRVLQRLRKEGLITYANKHLEIKDWDRLKTFGDFDPRYMHLSEAVMQ